MKPSGQWGRGQSTVDTVLPVLTVGLKWNRSGKAPWNRTGMDGIRDNTIFM